MMAGLDLLNDEN
jgi:succinyl-CoA synthetase beta subunit